MFLGAVTSVTGAISASFLIFIRNSLLIKTDSGFFTSLIGLSIFERNIFDSLVKSVSNGS